MKKRNLFIAALLVAAATTVAVVSCKKESQDALLNNAQPAKAFTPPEVDDMNAYLKDFKQKMKDSQSSRDGETLSLEEAAWHLASVANYDFANANVPFDDIRFDTLYSNVTVTGGSVLLNDVATAYESISTDLDNFYQNLLLENKHFRFIGCTISEQGEVIVPVITTFSDGNKWHYFTDDSFCDQYFSDEINYSANGLAISTLTSLFNLILGKNTDPTVGRIYYVINRPNVSFKASEWPEDPENYCPNSSHSRLFCSGSSAYSEPIPKYAMCYYFDSILELAMELITPSSPSVVFGYLTFETGYREPVYISHVLHVDYGYAISGNIISY